MKRLIAAVLTLMAIVNTTTGQNTTRIIKGQTISYSDFIKLITTSQDDLLVFSNCRLYSNTSKPYLISDSLTSQSNHVSPNVILDSITVDPNIGKGFGSSMNGVPTGNLNLYDLVFDNGLLVTNCDFDHSIKFKKCTFNSRVVIHSNSYFYARIDSCSFLSDFVYRDQRLILSNSQFVSSFQERRSFYSNTNDSLSQFRRNVYKSPVRWSINPDSESVSISNCSFSSDTSLDQVDFGGDFASLSIQSSKFSVPLSLKGIKSISQLEIVDSYLELLDISKVTFPSPTKVNIPFTSWIQIGTRTSYKRISSQSSGAITWRNENFSFWGEREAPVIPKYTIVGDTQIERTDIIAEYDPLYYELIPSYHSLLNIYKARGDLESWNACNKRLENIRTNYLANKFKSARTPTSLIEWKLHSFLGFYSYYGSSPARAILVSIQTILFFSLFYFFFYSEWDKISRDSLVRKHSVLIDYLTNEQRIADFYSEKNIEKLELYNTYHDKIISTHSSIPWTVRILGFPLYYSTMANHKFIIWLYSQFELVKGKWIDLPNFKRHYISTIVTLSLIAFMIRVVIIRLLNSIFLSLNAFSTLGFGIIPVKGLLRYVAILEGFVGWFFLSLFLASLLNQSSSF